MSDDLLKVVVQALQSAPSGTIEKIATSSGLDRMTISRIKNGAITNPRWETLKAIADYFGKVPQSESASR
jgi:transcriptional regulator with XRE-family HTH domain